MPNVYYFYTEDCTELTVPPECQGQTVVRYYALCPEEELVIRRTYDRSDGEVRWYAADWNALTDEFDPDNYEPRLKKRRRWWPAYPSRDSRPWPDEKETESE